MVQVGGQAAQAPWPGLDFTATFTNLRLTFSPHPVADSHHVPNVWLQRKGGSQKLDPPPLFKGGGGSGSP